MVVCDWDSLFPNWLRVWWDLSGYWSESEPSKNSGSVFEVSVS
jgi:hypothetical protein